MDAEGTVLETVSELREYMNRYAAAKGEWIAPYTSLVISSMMGKSRHMKEVANCLPSVYICLRGEVRGYGYPRCSPSIVDWSSMGASTILSESSISVSPPSGGQLLLSPQFTNSPGGLTTADSSPHWASTTGRPKNWSLHGFGNSLLNRQIPASFKISGSKSGRRRIRSPQMEFPLTLISKRHTRMMFGTP